jgi:hypothetical protein
MNSVIGALDFKDVRGLHAEIFAIKILADPNRGLKILP